MLLANEQSGEDVPNWSPDGNTLMFGRTLLDNDGNATATSICMFDLKARQLSNLPGSDNMGPPVWSPDGRYVAAQSSDFRSLMLFDFHSQHWIRLASGGFIHSPQWRRDSRSIYYQDLSEGENQPIYQIAVPSGRVEEIASRKQFLRADFSRFVLTGLTPANEPVAVVVRQDADIYALDLDLP